jgi:hypothetical protein
MPSFFELFLNPWSMLAGTLLVSSPIIIHLINRIRFRRVHWAAMEFLLKSQKKNRKKLIIEQLILLLLRILLVLLAGLLVARFLGFNLSAAEQNTLHLVLLDDTPSMGDFWGTPEKGRRADDKDAQPAGGAKPGEALNTFAAAKDYIVQSIGKEAAQANTPQSLQLIRFTELDKPQRYDPINESNVEALRQALEPLKPSAVHATPLPALEKAKAVIGEHPNTRVLLHVVSDFRAKDWSGGDADALRGLLGDLNKQGVQVHLHDMAYPFRNKQNTMPYNDNLGIVDLQPETRVVPKNMPVEFTVGVANYSNNVRQGVRVTVRVNGQERPEASFTILTLPPGPPTQKTFSLSFERVASKEKPLERFSLVSASLENESAGLVIDNVRYTVVEVRDKVPMLVVDNDPALRGKKQSEAFYLKKFFTDGAKGIEFVEGNPADLEKPTLAQYPLILLVDLPRLTDAAVANLEEYVANGGGVAFFLGKDVQPDFYNARLYKDGQGIFPAPLADRPAEPAPPPPPKLEPTSPGQDRAEPPRIFPRSDTHPIFQKIYKDDKTHENDKKYLPFVTVSRYYPVPRARWNVPLDKRTELMTLPNDKSVEAYKAEVQSLLADLDRVLASPPKENPDAYKRFQPSLKVYGSRVLDVLVRSQPLYTLAQNLDDMLSDRGDPKDPNRPNLQEFWRQPELADLFARMSRLLEATRFGDPFVVERSYGKGRVIAYLSSAGTSWTDWPNFIGAPYYSMFMLEMQKYLASVGADANRPVGSVVTAGLDAGRHGPVVKSYLLAEAPRTSPGAESAPLLKAGPDTTVDAEGSRRPFAFRQTREPGVYLFEFDVPPPPPKPGAKPAEGSKEYQAHALNVDTLAEGDLRRVSRDELEAAVPGAGFHTPLTKDIADVIRNKPRDLSESAWLYLLLLLILIAEQAMAVRLSYHLRDGATPGPRTSASPVPQPAETAAA